MASRRELIEADDFRRRQGVAALVRGDTLAVEDVPRRPNAAVLGGAVLVVLIAAVTAGSAFLTGRAPDGWRDDGSLVVDRETGARYLAEAGALRPAPTVTAAVLAGARGEPVLVPHARVLSAPLGPPVPDDGSPEAPPVLADPRPALTACTPGGPDDRVDVFAGDVAGTPLRYDGLLARAAGDSRTVLVAGGRTHDVDPASLPALGWAPAQVRDVPASWLALLPRGGALEPAAAPGPVVGTDDGAVYVLDRGRARLVADDTTARLLGAPARRLDPDDLAGLPGGPPFGLRDVPSEPPEVPARETTAVGCVTGGGTAAPRLVVLDAAADTPATRATLPTRLAGEPPVVVTWHVAPGGGVLLAPPGFDAARRPTGDEAEGGREGVVVASGGIGYAIADDEALRALGYDRAAVTPIGEPWLGLLARGPLLDVPG